MPVGDKHELLDALSVLKDFSSIKGHVCFATSGSTGRLKWVLLSKEAMGASAEAVNRHLDVSSADSWLNPLPDFHVGGVGIVLRGLLSKIPVVPCLFPQGRWSTEKFVAQLKESQATLTAIVPTQLHDLVTFKISAPSSLRAMVVGGGALSESLYFAAISLGWKILPSYGLTECASQVATAPLDSWKKGGFPLLKPLDHVELRMKEEATLQIKSCSLLTGYLEKNKAEKVILRDPKIDDWFSTEDQAVFEKGWLKAIRRENSVVKIGGENVDVSRLEKILQEERLKQPFSEDMALIAKVDERLGHAIHLLVAPQMSQNVQELIDRYQQRVFPFERIRHVQVMETIPRSALGKLLRQDSQGSPFGQLETSGSGL
jgi:o-succinylbenzoate---CoA ligase